MKRTLLPAPSPLAEIESIQDFIRCPVTTSREWRHLYKALGQAMQPYANTTRLELAVSLLSPVNAAFAIATLAPELRAKRRLRLLCLSQCMDDITLDGVGLDLIPAMLGNPDLEITMDLIAEGQCSQERLQNGNCTLDQYDLTYGQYSALRDLSEIDAIVLIEPTLPYNHRALLQDAKLANAIDTGVPVLVINWATATAQTDLLIASYYGIGSTRPVLRTPYQLDTTRRNMPQMCPHVWRINPGALPVAVRDAHHIEQLDCTVDICNARLRNDGVPEENLKSHHAIGSMIRHSTDTAGNQVPAIALMGNYAVDMRNGAVCTYDPVTRALNTDNVLGRLTVEDLAAYPVRHLMGRSRVHWATQMVDQRLAPPKTESSKTPSLFARLWQRLAPTHPQMEANQ